MGRRMTMHGYCVKGGWQVFCVQVCLVKVCRFVGGLAGPGPPFCSSARWLPRDWHTVAQVSSKEIGSKRHRWTGWARWTRRTADTVDKEWPREDGRVSRTRWSLGARGEEIWMSMGNGSDRSLDRSASRWPSKIQGQWHLHRADFSPPCPAIWDFRTPATKSLPSQRAA